LRVDKVRRWIAHQHFANVNTPNFRFLPSPSDHGKARRDKSKRL